MGKKQSVLIVIPVYNRHHDLIVLMDSIFKINTNNIDICIIIIDDNSTIPVNLNPNWKKFKIHILRNIQNMGPAYSRNIAVRMIKSDYIWFLDSDAEILNPDVLENMVNVLQSDNRICAVGGIIEEIQGQAMILEGRDLINYLFVYDIYPAETYTSKMVAGFSSTNFFIARDLFRSVAGFDEKLMRDEDADLCLKLRKKRLLFYQSKETAVFHRFSNKGRKNNFSDHYCSKKNYIKALLETRLYIIAKHSPSLLIVLPFLDLITSISIFFRIARKRYHLNRIKTVESRFHASEIIPILILLIKSYLLGIQYPFMKNTDFQL